MADIAINIEHVSKQYHLGAIGGRTLREDVNKLLGKLFHRKEEALLDGHGRFAKNGVFWALDDISLEVTKGERVGIIGHNGAGKSTLLKLLSRVTAPTKGTITYHGRISSMLEVGTGFHPELTGRENIYMNGTILGMSNKEISSKFDEIVEFAEMGQFIDTPVKRYSSGMYVKLAFAVAAHLDNDIMVMDEVLAVGDMKFQRKCLGKMEDASKGQGKTVLYVSHNMNTIRQLCNRCVVLSQGRLIYDGTVEKAIGFYLGDSDIDFPKVVDMSNKHHHQDVKTDFSLLKLEFLNYDHTSIKQEEPLDFVLTVKSGKAIDNLGFRLVLHGDDGMPVGVAVIRQNIKIHSGISNIKCRLNCPNLAPGAYKFDVIFYQLNNFGESKRLDAVELAAGFIRAYQAPILNGQNFDAHYWGHVLFDGIETDLE